VVAGRLEPVVERIFHTDSDGYRVGRSAIDAVAKCRQRCWKHDWVIDLDIQKFFDTCPHELIVKAVAANTDQAWVVLYVQRWLTAPMATPDGVLAARDQGTPQGGLCSAEHKPPNEQRWVMRSAGLAGLVRA
jgi:retron-type reverse transcriptase